MGISNEVDKRAKEICRKCIEDMDRIGLLATVEYTQKAAHFIHGPVTLGGSCKRMPADRCIIKHPETFGHAVQRKVGDEWQLETESGAAFNFCPWCSEELSPIPF